MKSVLRQYTTLRAAQPANSFWRAHKATFDTVRYHLLSAQKQRSRKLYADGSMGQHNTSAASNESLEAARHERLHRGIDNCRRQCPSRLRRGNNMPAYHVRAVIPSPHRPIASHRRRELTCHNLSFLHAPAVKQMPMMKKGEVRVSQR